MKGFFKGMEPNVTHIAYCKLQHYNVFIHLGTFDQCSEAANKAFIHSKEEVDPESIHIVPIENLSSDLVVEMERSGLDLPVSLIKKKFRYDDSKVIKEFIFMLGSLAIYQVYAKDLKSAVERFKEDVLLKSNYRKLFVSFDGVISNKMDIDDFAGVSRQITMSISRLQYK